MIGEEKLIWIIILLLTTKLIPDETKIYMLKN